MTSMCRWTSGLQIPGLHHRPRQYRDAIAKVDLEPHLNEMGVEPGLVDIIDSLDEGSRPFVVPSAEVAKLHIVTPP